MDYFLQNGFCGQALIPKSGKRPAANGDQVRVETILDRTAVEQEQRRF